MIYDCIVMGGGPAGLTGAIYLARFCRTVCVIDAGRSRARLIPTSHNIPGFMHGISGLAFLQRLREQARQFGVTIADAEAVSVTRDDDGPFRIETTAGVLSGRKVLFATGIVDKAPDLDGLSQAVARGVVRYCPVCDGYEAADRSIGILGPFDVAVKKAMFLRTYSADVRIWWTGPTGERDTHRALRQHGIRVASAAPLARLVLDNDVVHGEFGDGSRDCVDVLYPVLGSDVRSGMARAIGAACTDIGCLRVDDRQGTSVPGLFAAGDVVSDLHQITVAVGHAAIAADSIHRELPHCPR